MVRAIEEEQEDYKSKLFHFKGMHDTSAGRHSKSMSFDCGATTEPTNDDRITARSHLSGPIYDRPLERQQIGSTLTRNEKGPKLRLKREEAPPTEAKDRQSSDMELMKERFAKLLLGEDMSGGGKVFHQPWHCQMPLQILLEEKAPLLAHTLLGSYASVFGEQWRLEPMSAERKARWRKEIDWLLSVTDYVVEFVPSQQKSKDGANMEIMVTRQRTDLHMNIPALRKLDAMLIDCLDNFKDQNEFFYVSKDADESEQGNAKRKDDKWWLPTPKVPQEGLSEMSRKFLQYQKDCVNQVLKAAMAINAQVLSEMEIPESYIESLPKNGRASLGDSIYKSITVEFFDPSQFLSTMNLSSEHRILDLKNRIEASIVIWKRKMNQKDGKSAWGSAVSLEKRELFEERAETILLLLKQRFPGIPQSSLDISKIQFNLDVGQAVLESYSRILESLAFTVLSRIEDVLYADYVTQNPSHAATQRHPLRDYPQNASPDSFPSPRDENYPETPGSMTLSDFMGWGIDQSDAESKKDSTANSDDGSKDGEGKPPNHMQNGEGKQNHIQKLANLVTNKRISYLDNLSGLRSPTARH